MRGTVRRRLREAVPIAVTLLVMLGVLALLIAWPLVQSVLTAGF